MSLLMKQGYMYFEIQCSLGYPKERGDGECCSEG